MGGWRKQKKADQGTKVVETRERVFFFFLYSTFLGPYDPVRGPGRGQERVERLTYDESCQ